MNKYIVATVLSVIALLPPAASGVEAGAPGLLAACEADKKKLCRGIVPGDGRMVACMREHEKELSGACRAAFSRKTKEMKKATALCEADQMRLCGDVESGGDRIPACMAAHEAELSEACRAFMLKANPEMKRSGGKKSKKKAKAKPKAE